MVRSRECVHGRPLSSKSKCMLEQNHTLLTICLMTRCKILQMYLRVQNTVMVANTLQGDTLFHMPF